MYLNLNDGQVAYLNAHIAMMNNRRAGMEAENQHRLACGLSPAYGEEAFIALEREFEGILSHNAIVEMHRSNA